LLHLGMKGAARVLETAKAFWRRVERAPQAPAQGDDWLDLRMRFIRFVVASRHPDSGVEAGTFTLAYKLRDSPHVTAADRELLTETLAWFGENLETPTRFTRSKSKGFYRRKTRGIAWFKDTATEHLARMHYIKAILEKYGHSVTMLSETRVGYVTYEDACQVIAEPFSDTQTG
jgi:hypothetical protein